MTRNVMLYLNWREDRNSLEIYTDYQEQWNFKLLKPWQILVNQYWIHAQ